MLFTIIRTLVIVLACTVFGIGSVHALQIYRYQTPALRRELMGNGGPFLHTHVFTAVLAALLNWYLPILLSMIIPQQEYRETLCGWIMLGVFVLAAAYCCLHKIRTPRRKPFVWTQRNCRLMAAVFAYNLPLGTALPLMGGYALTGAMEAYEQARRRDEAQVEEDFCKYY